MWLYRNKIYEYDGESYGYVYQITNILTNRKYIGKKFFTCASYKTIKGKRKKIRKESDWKDYWGSSPTLKLDIDKYGKENFRREILMLCIGRAECSYKESKQIFLTDALLDSSYYNSFVGCKIHAAHLKGLHFNNTPSGDRETL